MIPAYAIAPTRPQAPLTDTPYMTWSLGDEEDWAAFYRLPDGYLVRFQSLCDFFIGSGGTEALCTPAPGLDEATREHVFYNQVAPLMLSEAGWLVFHASCVEVEGGAIAFIAQSGRGKSTLAALFATAGHRFLCDDAMVISPKGGRYEVLPNQPHIRLWSDSRAALLGDGAALADPISYTPKERVMCAQGLPYCDEPRTLRAVYILGEKRPPKARFTTLRGAEALAAWASAIFTLDVDDRRMLAGQFERLAPLSQSIPTTRLDYRRSYARAGVLRQSILAHASTLFQATT